DIHGVIFHNNTLVVFNQGTNENEIDFVTLQAYDLEKTAWREIATQGDVECGGTFPPLRWSPSICHVGQFVYICGGLEPGSPSDETRSSDLWQLDLLTFRWKKIPTSLPHSPSSHSVDVTPEGKMYLFGGAICSMSHNKTVNSLYSIWLKIPCLKEMCWEAVLHYAPWLDEVPLKTLIKAGIPRDLANHIILMTQCRPNRANKGELKDEWCRMFLASVELHPCPFLIGREDVLLRLGNVFNVPLQVYEFHVFDLVEDPMPEGDVLGGFSSLCTLAGRSAFEDAH
ncbi:unnamed protein product, partial [Darwinula stevensoni]